MSTDCFGQIDRACEAASRVIALLSGLENSLGEDRIGTYEFDSVLRRLMDMAREEAANLRNILMEEGAK